MMLLILNKLLASFILQDDYTDSLYYAIIPIVLLQIPVSMLPSLDKISYVISLGVVSDLCSYLLAAIFSYLRLQDNTLYRKTTLEPFGDASEAFSYLGLIFFCFDISSSMVNIRGEMHQTTGFHGALVLAMSYNALAQIVVGLLGALAFGSTTSQNVFVNVLNFMKSLKYMKLAALSNFLIVFSLNSSLTIDNYICHQVLDHQA
jgi:amino acid permease